MNKKQKFNLNADYRIEPILLSFTDDNYKSLIDQMIQALDYYDKDLSSNLNRYLWIADNQLGGKHLGINTLVKEFPTYIFSDYKPLSNDELLDYIEIFISQKKQRVISGKISLIADDIRTQGLTPELAEQLYKYTAVQDTKEEYVPIQSKFKDLRSKQAEMKGISLLCAELDKLTGGLLPGTVCTVLGHSGSMKTTYTANIAYNAMKGGRNILYLSLEESPMQLYSKLLSRASVDLGKSLLHQDITQNKLDENDDKVLYEEVEPYFNSFPGKFYIVGEQDLENLSLTSMDSVFKEIDTLATKETGHGIDILVVDHIQLLKFGQTDMSEYSAINLYMSFFRQQSLAWLHEKRQISVIVLSQANREGMRYAQKHNGMYLMQHVAEATEVERASTYIVSTYTDPMSQVTKLLKVGALKLRNAQLPMDTINVFADGAYYQVGDIIDSEQTDYSDADVFLDDTKPTTEQMDYSLDDLMEGLIL